DPEQPSAAGETKGAAARLQGPQRRERAAHRTRGGAVQSELSSKLCVRLRRLGQRIEEPKLVCGAQCTGAKVVDPGVQELTIARRIGKRQLAQVDHDRQ